MSNSLIYVVKLSLDGSFPGSPDHDYYRVNEQTWDQIHDMIKKFERFDTFDEARKAEDPK